MSQAHPKSGVVIAASSLPTENGIGSIFLRDFIEGCPDTHFHTSTVPPFFYPPTSISPILRRQWQGALALLGRKIPGMHSARVQAFRALALPRYVVNIQNNLLRMRASRIWLTASSPELIAVGVALAREGHDVRTTVWDDPEYFIDNLSIGRKQKALILSEFAELLKRSTKVSVISKAMNNRYKSISGKDSIILRHGARVDTSQRQPISDSVRIVFAGSMYSKAEWNAFIDTLDAAGWQIGRRKVKLYFIGHFPAHEAIRSPKVRYLGQMPFADTMKTLSHMHIGYLPYWFAPENELVARTSFPGKLSAYAAAGLAVFHHAPPYTEVADFLTEYPFGVTCSFLERNRIHEALSDLVEACNDPALDVARRLAVTEELSASAMAARFENLLAPEVAEQNTQLVIT